MVQARWSLRVARRGAPRHREQEMRSVVSRNLPSGHPGFHLGHWASTRERRDNRTHGTALIQFGHLMVSTLISLADVPTAPFRPVQRESCAAPSHASPNLQNKIEVVPHVFLAAEYTWSLGETTCSRSHRGREGALIPSIRGGPRVLDFQRRGLPWPDVLPMSYGASISISFKSRTFARFMRCASDTGGVHQG